MTENTSNWLVKRFGNCVGLLCMVAVMLCASLVYVVPVYALIELPDIVIDERTGVKFVFYDFTKHEPESKHIWNSETETVQVVPAHPYRRSIDMDRVRHAMEQYPVDIIKKYLNTIYLVDKMKIIRTQGRDVTPLGAYNHEHNAIYLVYQLGYTDHYWANLEQSFHHEFSSLLLRRNIDIFPYDEWLALNPSDFQYQYEYDPKIAFIEDGVAHSAEKEPGFFYKRCLPAPYALSGWDNDVNTFAEHLFRPRTRSGGYQTSVIAFDEYPCLQKKLDLLIAFYHRIHPMFTPIYFDTKIK